MSERDPSRSRARAVRKCFFEAVELPLDAREAYLVEACGDDPDLAEEVRSLLRADSETSPFLEGSAAEEHAPPSGETTPRRFPPRIGRFRLRKILGEGGMGTVYLADEDGVLRRPVAVKVVKGVNSKEVISRFKLERQALALMNHSHIARVYDGGTTDEGHPYFVMEYVPGSSITEFFNRRRLGVRPRLELFVSVCEAIHHAHQRGVIHRDLKPSNILVCLEDEVPVAKIIDFGVAKALDQRLTEATVFTQAGHIVGTPAYMSPEQTQLDSHELDIRTDVYSLGVLLYEILVGVLPFDTERLRRGNLVDFQRRVLEVDPPPASTRLSRLGEGAETIARERATDVVSLRRAIRGDLDWIIQKAMAKDRSRRYASASELATDLRQHLAGDPVSAGPPTLGYRLYKFARRHRTLVVAATVSLLLLSLSSIVSLGLYLRSQRALLRSEGLRLTAEANAIRSSEPDLALILALEGAKRYPGLAGRNALLASLEGFVPHRALQGHEAWIYAAGFSPDGRRVATGGWDGTVRLWSTEDGRLVHLLRHPGKIGVVAFDATGRYLASGSNDARVRIWDPESGEQIHSLPHPGMVYTLVFSPEGDTLATGSSDGSVRLWKVSDGTPLSMFEVSDSPVMSLSYRPDGEQLIAGAGDGDVRILAASSGETVGRIDGHRTVVHTVAWSPDGRRVLAASHLAVRLVAPEAEEPDELLVGHQGHVNAAAWSPDGRYVVAAVDDGTVVLWEGTTGRFVRFFKGHESAALCVAFSPHGKQIASGAIDRSVRLWNLESGKEEARLRGHLRKVTQVSFSPDGSRLLSASIDRFACLWETGRARALLPVLEHPARVNTFALAPKGDRVITACSDGYARIWDRRSGRLETVLERHAGEVRSAAFSPDGSRVLTTSEDGSVRCADPTSGRALWHVRGEDRALSASFSPNGRSILIETPASSPTVVLDAGTGKSLDRIGAPQETERSGFSPDGNWIFTTSGPRIHFWDAATREPDLVLEGHRAAVRTVRFSPDGRSVVTASHDRTARLWDRNTGGERFRLEHEDAVFEALYSPDGQYVLTASWAPEARLWSARDGRLRMELKGHSWRLTAAAFSPDGARILTTSYDQTARVWDSASGEERLTFSGHNGRVLSPVRFTPDGLWAISVSNDHTVRIWPVDPGPLAETARPRELSAGERDAYAVESGGAE